MTRTSLLGGLGALLVTLSLVGSWSAGADQEPGTNKDSQINSSVADPNDPTIGPLEYFSRLRDAVESDAEDYFALGGDGPANATVYLVEGHKLTEPVQALIAEGPSRGVQVDVRQVPRSRAQLEAIIEAFPTTPLYHQLGANFSTIGFDLDANTVQIGLVELRPDDEARIGAFYGNSVTVTQTGQITTADSPAPGGSMYAGNPGHGGDSVITSAPKLQENQAARASTGLTADQVLIGLLALIGLAAIAIFASRRHRPISPEPRNSPFLADE
jgi:hypothetical protein